MRTFIALELPEEIKTEINQIQQGLKKVGVQAKWVRPKITHLTIAFLGSITPTNVEPIGEILKKASSEIRPIKLHLAKIGCFPNPAKARIIFVDLGGELDKLNALTKKIRKGLKKEKIWFDKKPFSAHLTLGRIKKRKNLAKVLKKAAVKKIEFLAKEVTLNKSNLGSAGPVYAKLRRVFLT